MFGPRGPANLLSRATTVAFALFMVTSITLALYSNKRLLSNANVSEEIERLREERQGLRLEDLPPAPLSEDPE